MFDVGFSEIFLLGLIGLIVLGPERLPGVARTIGGFVRKARTSWASLRKTIEAEMAEADLSAPIKKTKEELRKIGRDLTEAHGFVPKDGQSKASRSKAAQSDSTQPDSAQPDSASSDTTPADNTPVTGSTDGKRKNV